MATVSITKWVVQVRKGEKWIAVAALPTRKEAIESHIFEHGGSREMFRWGIKHRASSMCKDHRVRKVRVAFTVENRAGHYSLHGKGTYGPAYVV